MLNDDYADMTAIVPEGTKGKARIEHFAVSEQESSFTRIREMAHPGEYVPAGNYCRLFVGHSLMMTDTLLERKTNRGVIYNAKGDVLIAGLGIGLILVPILVKAEVRTVTIVEKYRDVIDLVEPSVRKLPGAEKLTIIEADIFEWAPPKGQKWDCIYFDIWADISTDTLKDMERLHKKFGRRKKPGAWMESWRRGFLQLQRERGGCY